MAGFRDSGLRPTPAIDWSATDLCAALNHCFEDYVVPFTLTAPQAERRFRRESLDVEASTVWLDDEGPAAVVFVARRGWTSRIAAMAVARRRRGQGVGKHVMSAAILEARSRGEKRVVLEVIEQNPPAIALYESVGMRKTRRIVGWERDGVPSRPGPSGLEPLDPSEAVRRFHDLCPADLPWNLQATTLAQLAPPVEAWTLDGRAVSLVSDLGPERAVLWQVAVAREHRGQGVGRSLIEGLASVYPGRRIFTSVDVPDDLARGFFQKTGFREMSVSQFEMAVDL
ncbi:MAG: GNAT family N-acetyltransferase [Armatimonadetes bacterium]|nr:GNAT family N-acetyltransferase [Armatimonadota bacterium]